FGITLASLEQGLQFSDPPLCLVTESELYGKPVMQRRRRKGSQENIDFMIHDLAELSLNDAVVHIEHGIGRYQGLQTLMIGDQEAEFLTLSYADDTKL